MSDVEQAIPVSDADAKKTYDAQKDDLPERRAEKGHIAGFELSDAQKELKGKDRTDALQKLGNDAWTLYRGGGGQEREFCGPGEEIWGAIEHVGIFHGGAA